MSYNSKYTGAEVESYLDLIPQKVDKVTGKQLSTEDFTTALKTKLEGLSNYDDSAIQEAVEGLQSQLNTLVSGDVDTAIESFNEIIAFLEGVEDTETLEGIIASIEQQIAAKYTKPSSGIPKSDLASAVQTSLGKADTALQSHQSLDGYVKDTDLATVATSGSYNDLSNKPTIPSAVTESTVSGWGFTKNVGTYIKPSAGIPKSDLASSVQTSLGKADTALQSHQDISGKQDVISDLATIRSNAEKGASAVQPSDLSAVATSGSYNDLTNKPTIPSEVTESTVSGWGFTKNTGTYSKPSTGIPKSDLASAVQTSLGKADTALQEHQSLEGYATQEWVEDQNYIGAVSDIYKLYGAELKAGAYLNPSTHVIVSSAVTDRTIVLAINPNTMYTIVCPVSSTKRIGTFTDYTVGLAATRYETITGDGNIIITSGAEDKYLVIQFFVNGDNETLQDYLDVLEVNMVVLDSILANYAKTADLAAVATSGSYNDLSDKPTIPSAVTVDSALSSTSTNPVQNKVINTALAGKQATISDLATIRSGASAGATAVQPSGLATVATSGSYADLTDKPTIPSAVTVDTALSTTSTNPAQNKVVTAGINAKYTKPSAGIPLSDLASAVQTSLGKADTALQSETYKGTITGITMNGASKGTSGVVNLGTVITAHQDISGKQDVLVSGTNIKTINGESILGEGDVEISGGSSITSVVFHDASETSIEMSGGVLHKWTSAITSLSLSFPDDAEGSVQSFKAVFPIGAGFTLSVPYYYSFENGEIPEFEEGKRCELNIEDGRIVCAMFPMGIEKFDGVELEYVDNDGTDYVLTDYVFSGIEYGVRYKAAALFSATGTYALAGTRSVSGIVGSTTCILWFLSGSRTAYWNGVQTSFGSYSTGVIYEDEITDSQNTVASSYPLVIFGANNVGTPSFNNNFRIYYLEILGENGEAIASFRPFRRNSDNAIGFYDVVGGAFYPSVNGTLTGVEK